MWDRGRFAVVTGRFSRGCRAQMGGGDLSKGSKPSKAALSKAGQVSTAPPSSCPPASPGHGYRGAPSTGRAGNGLAPIAPLTHPTTAAPTARTCR